MKAKILLSVLIVLAFFSANLNAQIFYQDIDPDIVLDSWNAKDINIDSTAGSTLSYGGAGNLSIWEEFNSRIVVNAFSGCEVFISNGFPAALNIDAVISSGGSWVQPNYAVLYDGSTGNWKSAVDKYLGVRVKKGADWLYGWIRLDVNATGTAVTIKDYACNRTVNSSINAGQNSNTSVNELTEQNDYFLNAFPNPTSGYIGLSLKDGLQPIIRNIEIYSVLGNKVFESEFKDRLDVTFLAPGVYFLKAGNKFCKFVKI